MLTSENVEVRSSLFQKGNNSEIALHKTYEVDTILEITKGNCESNNSELDR